MPSDLWAYVAFALLYPSHKIWPEERTFIVDPALRPVTVGSILARFGCIVMVRMHRVVLAKELLLSHQFSFGINGGGSNKLSWRAI